MIFNSFSFFIFDNILKTMKKNNVTFMAGPDDDYPETPVDQPQPTTTEMPIEIRA
jgi:hypothetical protein